METENKLKAQLKEVMNLPENQTCVDCGDKRPTWVSLITPPKGAAFSEVIGCFCCLNCSAAHRRMGTHICFVRSTDLDDFKETDIQALQNGGNELINTLYEGLLTDEQKSIVKPEENTEMYKRNSFIDDKYQHLKWYDKKIAERKSTYKFLMATGQFDDFFASRAKTADDSWHNSFNGPLEELSNNEILSPNTMSKLNRNDIAKIAKRISQAKLRKSLDLNQAFGLRGNEETSRGHHSAPELSSGGPNGQRALLGTLQRMDSKREMVDTIRDLGRDDENDHIDPKNVLQKARHMRLRRNVGGGDDIKLRRQVSTDSDPASTGRGSGSADTKPRGRGSGGTDNKVLREESDSDSKFQRSITFGADSIGAKSPSKLGRRRLPDRTKSLGSDVTKQQRRMRRYASNDTIQELSCTAEEPSRACSSSNARSTRSKSRSKSPGPLNGLKAGSSSQSRRSRGKSRSKSPGPLNGLKAGSSSQSRRSRGKSRSKSPGPLNGLKAGSSSQSRSTRGKSRSKSPGALKGLKAGSSSQSRSTRGKSRSKSPGALKGSKVTSRRQVRRAGSNDELDIPRGTKTPRTPYSRTQVPRRKVDDQINMNASKLMMGEL